MISWGPSVASSLPSVPDSRPSLVDGPRRTVGFGIALDALGVDGGVRPAGQGLRIDASARYQRPPVRTS